jgi:isocitrate dehydrogenase kinase/phosphatase
MDQLGNESAAAATCVETILQAYQDYQTRFRAITRRAKNHFAQCHWQDMQADTVLRLDLYKSIVDAAEADLRRRFGARIDSQNLWLQAKIAYTAGIADREEPELAETFFNSITRRIFHTVGVDPKIEFVNSEFDRPPAPGRTPILRTYPSAGPLADRIARLLTDFDLRCPFEDLQRDSQKAAEKIVERISARGLPAGSLRIEMVASPFYRDRGAYLVGRLISGDQVLPLVLALLNGSSGIFVDALLLHPDQVSILFSYTRAYFFVEAHRPWDLVRFLKTLLPHRHIAEVYIALGFNKHGKTELYRDLIGHLSVCGEQRFEIAQGQRGMVMIAFNMPHEDIIFKLIRDRFERPKITSRQLVMQKYDFVFKHDRAGRLVDVQTFEHLAIERCWFSDNLLAELAACASDSVMVEERQVILRHVYVERRVTPLDVYLKQARPSAARKAVLDFGRAIKDLACINIFPGDMLTKNFGVTRLGRVVFYDYDELCPLLACKFRRIPQARSDHDELADEPWYLVDENDVFPEEFKFFLGLSEELEQVFLKAHGDLLDVEFWHSLQQRILRGEWIPIAPYGPDQRLRV